MLQSSSINSIKTLNITKSCDFSADETCTLLAQFINNASLLNYCNVQYGSVRRIKVELKVASPEDESEAGAIKITD